MRDKIEQLDHFHFDAIFHSLTKMVRGILFIDEQGNIYRADEMISSITDYPLSELTSMSIFHLDESLTMLEWRKWWKDLQEKGNVQARTYWRNAEEKAVPIFFTACILNNESRSFAVYKVHLSSVNALFPLLQACTEFSNSAGWEWDLRKERLIVTDNFYSIFELDPSLYRDHGLSIQELLKDRLNPDQLSLFTSMIRDLRISPKIFEKKLDLQWEDTEKSILLQVSSFERETTRGKTFKIRGLVKELSSTQGHLTEAQSLLDRAQNMICWIREDGSISYANDSLINALGYSRKQLLDEVNIHRIDIENSRSQWSSFRSLVKREKAILTETSFQRLDGTIFPVEINLVPLERDLIGIIAKDITSKRQEEAEYKAALLQINQLTRQLEAENLYLQEEVSHHFENIISQSPAYAEVLHEIEQVAPTDSTVLIEGESGTGKELLAHAIHRLSQRQRRALVKVNCAVLPESLIESELFGHEKGAFTGADKRRIGRFELADGGTIFLDEIGELPLDVQAKLLRILQEGEFERVGGNTTISVNVRVIAATNRKLKQMVTQRKFREDLYYRLNVFPIENLPLRKRQEDIPLLAQHFLEKFSVKTGKNITNILAKDMKRMEEYKFPGNVRELENIIERAVILTSGATLNLSHWTPEIENATEQAAPEKGQKTMEQMQIDLIVKTLEQTHWRVSGPDGAAAILAMHPQTLYSRMRKLGIKRDRS